MKLCKNNRVDQEYELTPEEIAAKFWEWNGGDPIGNLDRVLRCFITANESEGGLSSVFDNGPEYDAVLDAALAAWPAGVE